MATSAASCISAFLPAPWDSGSRVFINSPEVSAIRVASNAFRLSNRAVSSLTAMMLLILICIVGQAQSIQIKSMGTVLGPDAPYIFPEKIVAGPKGDFYILDAASRSIFWGAMKENKIFRMCKPDSFGLIADIAVDVKDDVWILEARNSRVVKINKRCEPVMTFAPARASLRIAVNIFGEIAVLKGLGEQLFDLYDANGKLIRSFGQRLSYDSPAADYELSYGHLVSDKSGGFYFSFNYPPLIRHYGRSGKLFREIKPRSDIQIGPPNVITRQSGNFVALIPDYQVLVLDITIDDHGRLYFLTSGEKKAQALRRGTQKLFVTSSQGKILQEFILQEDFYHRLAAASSKSLFLLRNRKPFRLERYVLQ